MGLLLPIVPFLVVKHEGNACMRMRLRRLCIAMGIAGFKHVERSSTVRRLRSESG